MKKNIHNYRLLVFLLLAGAVSVFVRLYHITGPVADWHSWRQADTAAVARNFSTFGFDLLHPRYDDLSNIQSGKDNPNGWRMVEMPLYQAAGYGLNSIFPKFSLEVSLRLVSIFATAGSVFLMGILLYEFSGTTTAMIGAALYAILPFSIYYGRTILPDPFATFWALLSLILLIKNDQKRIWLVRVLASGLCAAISLLVRPMAIFLLFPSVYLLFRNFSLKRTSVSVLIYGFIACVPLLLWRRWILQYPEGIAVFDWLFNKGNIRFKGAWFHWLFAQRLAELILGYWGLVPFALGLVSVNDKKESMFSFLWLAGGLSYFVIFAAGNVQHDYYQALIIPIVIWFTAKGLAKLLQRQDGIHRGAAFVLAAVSCIFLFAFSWFTIRTYFWINHPEIIEAGKAADAFLPPHAKVIAPYNGDTSFLYQTKRQGWPLGFDIDKKIVMGAQYYVSVATTDDNWETNNLAREYPVLVKTDTYAIIDLTKKLEKH